MIGSFTVYRQEVRPFTDKQIELVRTSPPRPSSPSRTRGCSTNCASARRPRRTRPHRSARAADGNVGGAPGYQSAPPAILSQCLRPCWRKPCASAMPSSATSIVLKATASASSRRTTRRRRSPRRAERPSILSPGPSIRSSHDGDQSVRFTSLIRQRPTLMRSAIQNRCMPSNLAVFALFGRADAEGRRTRSASFTICPPGSPPLYREADRTGQELRRPGRHRHRERAAAQRTAPAHD